MIIFIFFAVQVMTDDKTPDELASEIVKFVTQSL